MIVAISGIPGTGKTTVSRSLARKLKWKYMNLHAFAKKKKCISGFDKKRKCDIVDVVELAKEVSKLKGNYIIEAHFAHDMPSDVLFILKAEANELRERLKGKGWSKKKVEENILAEIMDMCHIEAMELGKAPIVIDTTHKTAKEVATEIYKTLTL